MTTPSLTFRTITSQALEHAKQKLAFVLLERDLFQKYGSTAVRHLTDDDRRQLARLGHELGWKRLYKIVAIATIRTIKRWYRDLISLHEKIKATGGKKRTSAETEALIVQFARENGWGNDSWGALRIVGEMRKLGVTIVKSTVSAILKRHGIPPAPQRGRVTTDDRVIVHDPATTAAIDFAKVSILDSGAIILVSILIAIHLGTREIDILNVSQDPDGDLTVQCARNVTMEGTGFFSRLGIRTVIMDRDPVFTERFRELLSSAGCDPHRIAPYSPWENGYIERFHRSLRESLLQKATFDSMSALRKALVEFQLFFNKERPHQGIDNRIPLGSRDVGLAEGNVVRIPRVGGLLNHYERVA